MYSVLRHLINESGSLLPQMNWRRCLFLSVSVFRRMQDGPHGAGGGTQSPTGTIEFQKNASTKDKLLKIRSAILPSCNRKLELNVRANTTNLRDAEAHTADTRRGKFPSHDNTVFCS